MLLRNTRAIVPPGKIVTMPKVCSPNLTPSLQAGRPCNGCAELGEREQPAVCGGARDPSIDEGEDAVIGVGDTIDRRELVVRAEVPRAPLWRRALEVTTDAAGGVEAEIPIPTDLPLMPPVYGQRRSVRPLAQRFTVEACTNVSTRFILVAHSRVEERRETTASAVVHISRKPLQRFVNVHQVVNK
jgi:hypothetical protein